MKEPGNWCLFDVTVYPELTGNQCYQQSRADVPSSQSKPRYVLALSG